VRAGDKRRQSALFFNGLLVPGEINPLFKVGRALLALSEILFQAAFRAEFFVRKSVADKTEPAVTYLTTRFWLRDFGVCILVHSSGSLCRMRKGYR
jgi:hypothetical protein